MKFDNFKIAITDEVHLKAVCEVLETMGYTKGVSMNYESADEYPAVVAHTNGIYAYYCHMGSGGVGSSLITLTDLLSLRDKQIKEKIHA